MIKGIISKIKASSANFGKGPLSSDRAPSNCIDGVISASKSCHATSNSGDYLEIDLGKPLEFVGLQGMSMDKRITTTFF